MNFIYIWHDGKYNFKVFLKAMPTPGHDLEVNVIDLEFSYKIQTFCIYVYQAGAWLRSRS